MLRLSIIYKHNKLYSAVKKEFSITPHPPFFCIFVILICLKSLTNFFMLEKDTQREYKM